MDHFSTYARHFKGIVRRQSFAKAALAKPDKGCFLTLPGPEALCVRQAKRSGVLRRDTKVIAIEKRKDRRPEVTKSLTSLGVDHSLIGGDIKNIKVGNLPPVSILNLDMEESLGPSLVRKVAEFSEVLTDRSVLILTLTNYFISPTASSFHQGLVYACNDPRTMVGKAFSRINAAAGGIKLEGRYSLEYLSLLDIALSQFDVTCLYERKYADQRVTPMICFVLQLVRKAKSSRVDISAALEEIRQRQVNPSRRPLSRTRSGSTNSAKSLQTRFVNEIVGMLAEFNKVTRERRFDDGALILNAINRRYGDLFPS